MNIPKVGTPYPLADAINDCVARQGDGLRYDYAAIGGEVSVRVKYEPVQLPNFEKISTCTVTFPTKLGGRLLRKARLRKKKAKNTKTISFYALVKMGEASDNQVTLEIQKQGQ